MVNSRCMLLNYYMFNDCVRVWKSLQSMISISQLSHCKYPVVRMTTPEGYPSVNLALFWKMQKKLIMAIYFRNLTLLRLVNEFINDDDLDTMYLLMTRGKFHTE